MSIPPGGGGGPGGAGGLDGTGGTSAGADDTARVVPSCMATKLWRQLGHLICNPPWGTLLSLIR